MEVAWGFAGGVGVYFCHFKMLVMGNWGYCNRWIV